MWEFRDLASDRGLRLMGRENRTSRNYIEIGLHYTAEQGDFIVFIEFDGTSTAYIISDFDTVIKFVTENYGSNNLEEFKEKADRLHREMFTDKCIIKWKKRSRPLSQPNIYKC